MLDLHILKRVLIVGIIVQLGLVAAGYFRPELRPSLLFGVMMAAAVVGLLYGRDLGRGFLAGMLGGAVAGAGSGLAAVAAAHYLDEQPQVYLPYGVMVTMLTGTVGGVFGELDVRLRAYIIRRFGNQ